MEELTTKFKEVKKNSCKIFKCFRKCKNLFEKTTVDSYIIENFESFRNFLKFPMTFALTFLIFGRFCCIFIYLVTLNEIKKNSSKFSKNIENIEKFAIK